MQFEYKIMLHWQRDISPEHKAEAESLTNPFNSRGETKGNQARQLKTSSVHSVSCCLCSKEPHCPTNPIQLTI